MHFLTSPFQSLECLVRLASVRRSLFTNDAARSKFLDHLMSGTKEILRTGQGLQIYVILKCFADIASQFSLSFVFSSIFLCLWLIGLSSGSKFIIVLALRFKYSSHIPFKLVVVYSRFPVTVSSVGQKKCICYP